MGENMKQCKSCCRDITDEQAKEYNGYCKKCYEEIQKMKRHDSNIQNDYDTCNKVAKTIKIIAIIICILGIISSLSMMTECLITEGLGFTIIVGSIIASVFMYGYGEMIQLLEDIKNK